MGIILLFFGPPLLAALVACFVLHIPFSFFKHLSQGFWNYWIARFVLAILGFVGLFVFKLMGGYENVTSSEFSPIGTDERGLALVWITIGVCVFGLLSIAEISYTLTKRRNTQKKRR